MFSKLNNIFLPIFHAETLEGELVTGNIFVNSEGSYVIVYQQHNNPTLSKPSGSVELIYKQVKYNTISQWIGIYDYNNLPVFTNDKVLVDNQEGIIKYDDINCRFVIESNNSILNIKDIEKMTIIND